MSFQPGKLYQTKEPLLFICESTLETVLLDGGTILLFLFKSVEPISVEYQDIERWAYHFLAPDGKKVKTFSVLENDVTQESFRLIGE